MRYVKLVLLWILGLTIPFLIAWLTTLAGWDAIPKIMVSCIGGYSILAVTGVFMKLSMKTSLDQIGGWTLGINVIALSLGGADLYFVIGSTIGILTGWFLLERSKQIWQQQLA